MKKPKLLTRVILFLIAMSVILGIAIMVGIEYNDYIYEPKTIINNQEEIFQMAEIMMNGENTEKYVFDLKNISEKNNLKIKYIIGESEKKIEKINISSNGKYILVVKDRGQIQIRKENIEIITSINGELKLNTNYLIIKFLTYIALIIIFWIFLKKVVL